MVFDTEAVFRQFLNCKFRDNLVRLLHLPLYNPPILLGVTKWGNVGLYNPTNMGLLHTFCLDLEYDKGHYHTSRREKPKCQRSHVIVDAIVAENIRCVIFATTKGILQCYDTGDLQEEDLGLDILPRRKFLSLSKGHSPLPVRNLGLLETHRIHGLDSIPTCLAYYLDKKGQHLDSTVVVSSKLLIGFMDGTVSILELGEEGNKYPFGLGKRKIRGTINRVEFSRLDIRSYRGHQDPVKEIQFLGSGSNRKLILSISRDPKFSLFCEDYTGISESFIISLPKGVNTIVHSNLDSMIITGSEDGIIRIFSQFSMRMPQMELSGHKAAIVGLTLLPVPFSKTEILLSYSEDVELRAWDPNTFVCLQNIYIRFPGGILSSTIICKTPQFAKNPIILVSSDDTRKDKIGKGQEDDPFILIIYCNSYAKLNLDRMCPSATREWPFDFDFDGLINPSKMKETTTQVKHTGKRNAKLTKFLSLLDDDETIRLENTTLTTVNALMEHKYEKIDKGKSSSFHKNRNSTKDHSTKNKSLTALAMRTLASLDISGGATTTTNTANTRNVSIFNKLPYHDIQDVLSPQPPTYYMN